MGYMACGPSNHVVTYLPRITGSPLEVFCSDLEHLGFISACCEVCLEVPAVRAPQRVRVLLVKMVLLPMA